MYGEMEPSSERAGGGFGADTMDKSSEYRSDETYSEIDSESSDVQITFNEEPRKTRQTTR